MSSEKDIRINGEPVVFVTRREWDENRRDIEHMKALLTETRDTSRDNNLQLKLIVVPALGDMKKIVDEHEEVIEKGKGAAIVIGLLWTVITVAMSWWFSSH